MIVVGLSELHHAKGHDLCRSLAPTPDRVSEPRGRERARGFTCPAQWSPIFGARGATKANSRDDPQSPNRLGGAGSSPHHLRPRPRSARGPNPVRVRPIRGRFRWADARRVRRATRAGDGQRGGAAGSSRDGDDRRQEGDVHPDADRRSLCPRAGSTGSLGFGGASRGDCPRCHHARPMARYK